MDAFAMMETTTIYISSILTLAFVKIILYRKAGRFGGGNFGELLMIHQTIAIQITTYDY